MKKSLLLIVLLTLCLCLLPVAAGADFGDFSGDSDFGSDWSSSDFGSDWGSGSDYDWDSSDSYSSYSSYSGYSGSSGDSGGGSPLWTVLIFAALVIWYFMQKSSRKGKKSGGQNTPAGAQRVDQSQLRSMSEYQQLDPGFDQSAFQEKLGNLYVQMQNGWQERNIESLRPYFTDALFAQMDRQLSAMRKARRTNYVERIAVLGVTLRGFCQRNGEDHIIAELRTRIVDYTLNDETGELISGSQSKEKFMTYEWDLSRESGRKTGEAAEMTTVNCPNCGAPVSINTTAKCPYCDSVITLDSHDWAICSIKGISQRTA